MPLNPWDERTVKRALRLLLRQQELPDPGPNATVDELLKLAQERRTPVTEAKTDAQ